MKIAISCETTVDLPEEILTKFDIKTVPFSILLGEEMILDGQDVSQKIFDYVAKTKVLPKTSAVNEVQYEEHFLNLLKDYDAVVHISLSSKISSACDNAKKVAEKLGLDKVVVVDSLSLSTGIALLAIEARKCIDKGMNLSEVYKYVSSRVKDVQASFVLLTLNYLYKGGRCSSIAYFGANLLKIKPEILMIDGEMKPVKKIIGIMKNVTQTYFNDLMTRFPNPELENVFITHTGLPKEDVESLKVKLKERGFKNIYETRAGGTISSHCGPGCFGILFLNKEK